MNKFLLLLLLSFVAISCKKEKIRGCTDSQALNYKADADADDGSCTYLRNRFLGDYSGIQSCSSGDVPDFSFSVDPSPHNINRIQLAGVPLSGNFSYADLKSNPNEFFIPPQLFISDLDSSNVSGNGYMKGDSLFIELIRESSFGVDTCYTRAVKLTVM